MFNIDSMNSIISARDDARKIKFISNVHLIYKQTESILSHSSDSRQCRSVYFQALAMYLSFRTKLSEVDNKQFLGSDKK